MKTKPNQKAKPTQEDHKFQTSMSSGKNRFKKKCFGETNSSVALKPCPVRSGQVNFRRLNWVCSIQVASTCPILIHFEESQTGNNT